MLDRTLLVWLHLIQLEEMESHRLGYRCSSDVEAQWNSMKLGLSQPILLIKSPNLFCPLRWTGIVEGNLYAIGNLYSIVQAESANYVSWRLSASEIHLALPPASTLPNYWRRAGASLITLLWDLCESQKKLWNQDFCCRSFKKHVFHKKWWPVTKKLENH